jgi:flavin-dependent dehydrogenase
MKQSHFTKKYSVRFVSASGKLSAPFYFWDNKPHECSQTWQVVRSEFDTMMLNNAREHGVDAHEGVRVLEVLFEGDQAVGVKIQADGEAPQEVRAKVVVDATGQSAMLQNRFKLRVWDPILNKGAIWTYWRGAARDTGRDEGATIVIQTPNKVGWFWYIPQHDDVVSVGVVGPFEYLFKGRGSHEQTYNEEVEACPAVKGRIAAAERVTGYFATKDYSYRSKQVSGDGWVLIGDALGFLDPLYSSGVLLALKSGEMAADAIVEGLRQGDLSAAQLGKWGGQFSQGVDRMRRLVCEYYDGFSFGKFIRAYPHLTGTVTDLLIGDLFTERVDEVWGPLESMYPPGKEPPAPWFSQPQEEIAENKANELFLPEGPRP